MSTLSYFLGAFSYLVHSVDMLKSRGSSSKQLKARKREAWRFESRHVASWIGTTLRKKNEIE
jgi:hypothetical protein